MSYIEPSQAAAEALLQRNIQGPIVMLNLLRFKQQADYSQHPELAPPSAISGHEAYLKYMECAAPFLSETGGEVLFFGKGGSCFIGPEDEYWDIVMMVKQNSVQDFFAFATNHGYQAILGHRTAALADSRLLPMTTTLA